MKRRDLTFIVFFVLVLCLSITYLFQTSYAKYRKQVTGELNADIASWIIKVNNEDITESRTLENEITPVFDTNQYVKANTIAGEHMEARDKIFCFSVHISAFL